MPSKLPQFTIRISSELLQKLNYIAECNSRSPNREIEQLIKIHLAEFEDKHGKVKIDE